jgi:hypothetical protein
MKYIKIALLIVMSTFNALSMFEPRTPLFDAEVAQEFRAGLKKLLETADNLPNHTENGIVQIYNDIYNAIGTSPDEINTYLQKLSNQPALTLSAEIFNNIKMSQRYSVTLATAQKYNNPKLWLTFHTTARHLAFDELTKRTPLQFPLDTDTPPAHFSDDLRNFLLLNKELERNTHTQAVLAVHTLSYTPRQLQLVCERGLRQAQEKIDDI